MHGPIYIFIRKNYLTWKNNLYQAIYRNKVPTFSTLYLIFGKDLDYSSYPKNYNSSQYLRWFNSSYILNHNSNGKTDPQTGPPPPGTTTGPTASPTGSTLIPKLHVPGPPTSSYEHHLLQDFSDPLTYEGVVRDSVPFTIGPPPEHQTPPTPSTISNELPATDRILTNGQAAPAQVPEVTSTMGPKDFQPVGQRSANRSRDEGGKEGHKSPDNSLTGSLSKFMGEGTYSTGLSVTIAIGTTLLILNVLIFAGILYKREKHHRSQSGRGQEGVGGGDKRRGSLSGTEGGVCGGNKAESPMKLDGGGREEAVLKVSSMYPGN